MCCCNDEALGILYMVQLVQQILVVSQLLMIFILEDLLLEAPATFRPAHAGRPSVTWRHSVAEKKAERERAAANQNGENFVAASGAVSPAPSKRNITKPRPPPTFAGRVVLKRPEVGIKISTVFDSGETPTPMGKKAVEEQVK